MFPVLPWQLCTLHCSTAVILPVCRQQTVMRHCCDSARVPVAAVHAAPLWSCPCAHRCDPARVPAAAVHAAPLWSCPCAGRSCACGTTATAVIKPVCRQQLCMRHYSDRCDLARVPEAAALSFIFRALESLWVSLRCVAPVLQCAEPSKANL